MAEHAVSVLGARPEEVQLAELVQEAKGGDRSAFDELVRRTYGDLYSLAYRMAGNADDACDVLQDSYLRAFRALAGFRGDAAVSTWLYRITANCASSHLSRRGRTRHDRIEECSGLVDDRPGSDPEAMAATSLDRTRVASALAELPARLRSVVVLRDIYDLPHEAIAKELNITETAAKVRLHRARKKLRERLYAAEQEVEADRAV
ncbi:MAG: RNA polymerase sigma factor [Actinomycetota bacterium]|nr:RNA polymerase sigma factor [Actinomycetota bacterium]